MKALRFICFGLLAAATMFAQGPGGRRGPRANGGGGGAVAPQGGGCSATGPAVTDITSYLTLTAPQLASLQSIRTTYCTTTQTARQQIASDEQKLQTLIQASSTDAVAMGNLLVDINNQNKSIQTAQSSLQTQALAVLTPAQKTLLANLQAAVKLQPAIQEAEFLDLLSPPTGGGFLGPRGRPGQPIR